VGQFRSAMSLYFDGISHSRGTTVHHYPQLYRCVVDVSLLSSRNVFAPFCACWPVTTRWSNWECGSLVIARVRTPLFLSLLSFSLSFSWFAPAVRRGLPRPWRTVVYTVRSRVVPTDEYEAGKVSLGVSLLVLSLSHMCVTHVGRPRASGRAYVRAYHR